MPCNSAILVERELGELVRLREQRAPVTVAPDERRTAVESAMQAARAVAEAHCGTAHCEPPEDAPDPPKGVTIRYECSPINDPEFTAVASTAIVQYGRWWYVQATYTNRYLCECQEKHYYSLGFPYFTQPPGYYLPLPDAPAPEPTPSPTPTPSPAPAPKPGKKNKR